VYPAATRASDFSRLRCDTTPVLTTGSGDQQTLTQRCYVSSLDMLGPVAFSADDFVVMVQRRSSNDATSTDPLVAATEVSWAWSAGGNAGVGVLSFTLNSNTRVFDGVVEVRAASKTIRGSPSALPFGIAPGLFDLRLVKCARGFAVSGGGVRCYVSVTAGMTPDPAFIVAEADVGAVTCKYANNDTASTDRDPDLKGLSLIVLCYSAPIIAGPERVVAQLSVSRISSTRPVAIAGSPVNVAVYPNKLQQEKSDTRVAAVVSGFAVFLPVLLLGTYFNYKHSAQQSRQLARLVEHQATAAEASKPRPLFQMPADPSAVPVKKSADGNDDS
jgi:hypothetical protein